MKRLIYILPFLGIFGCSPVLYEKYSYTRNHESVKERLSFSFTFNTLHSTFIYSTKHQLDSVFGYYIKKGNILVLEEYSRSWNCEGILSGKTVQLKFVSKYDSLPLMNQIVYINKLRYETDLNGLILIEVANSNKIEINPILFKPFLVDSICQNMIFYVEQPYFQNTDLLRFKIRKKRIISMEGNSYYQFN